MTNTYIFLVCLQLLINSGVARQINDLQGHSNTYEVRLGKSAPIDHDLDSVRHSIVAINRQSKEVTDIEWIDYATTVTAAKAYDGLAVITGKLDDAADTISIVNIASKKLNIFILCRKPSVSPDGRYIAYLDFKPLHSTLSESADMVALYNLNTSSPNDQNLGTDSRGWVWDSASHGVIIFPSERSGNRLSVPDATTLDMSWYLESGLYWTPDSHQLLFVVNHDGTHLLVAIEIGSTELRNRARTRKIEDERTIPKGVPELDGQTIEVQGIQLINQTQVLLRLKQGTDSKIQEVQMSLPK